MKIEKYQCSSWETSDTLIDKSEEGLKKKVEKYFDEFNPWGYGTSIAKRGKDGDMFYAVVRRAKSCD